MTYLCNEEGCDVINLYDVCKKMLHSFDHTVLMSVLELSPNSQTYSESKQVGVKS